MKIPSVPHDSTPQGVHRFLSLAMAQNIEYGSPQAYGTQQSPQNIKGTWIQVTSPSTPNTNFTVPHQLGSIPSGFHVVNKTAACDVYQGATPWTSNQITLKCTQASVALTLFVL